VLKVKGKGQSRPKKLLLGVTRDGVLFMDHETKEIVKEYQLTQLKRWAAAPTTFTLDFGDYADEYTIIITDEGNPLYVLQIINGDAGEAISSLIAGYIDILLKKKNGKL
jgi:talin